MMHEGLPDVRKCWKDSGLGPAPALTRSPAGQSSECPLSRAASALCETRLVWTWNRRTNRTGISLNRPEPVRERQAWTYRQVVTPRRTAQSGARED